MKTAHTCAATVPWSHVASSTGTVNREARVQRDACRPYNGSAGQRLALSLLAPIARCSVCCLNRGCQGV
eukprot:5111931-Prymnesium_polylepis.1